MSLGRFILGAHNFLTMTANGLARSLRRQPYVALGDKRYCQLGRRPQAVALRASTAAVRMRCITIIATATFYQRNHRGEDLPTRWQETYR